MLDRTLKTQYLHGERPWLTPHPLSGSCCAHQGGTISAIFIIFTIIIFIIFVITIIFIIITNVTQDIQVTNVMKNVRQDIEDPILTRGATLVDSSPFEWFLLRTSGRNHRCNLHHLHHHLRHHHHLHHHLHQGVHLRRHHHHHNLER